MFVLAGERAVPDRGQRRPSPHSPITRRTAFLPPPLIAFTLITLVYPLKDTRGSKRALIANKDDKLAPLRTYR